MRSSSQGLVFIIQLVSLVSFSVGQNEYKKLFSKCSEEKNMFDCLKRRALDILDSAVQDNTVYAFNDFISLTKDPKFVPSERGRILKNETLDEQLERMFYEYMSSRSVQLTIPGDAIEGRKKKDKFGGMMLMGGLAMAGVMVQLAMGKIAFLAGTALLTAKIALVLSAIIGLKKLASGGGGNHEVIYATATEHHGGGGSGGGGYGGWQRSFKDSAGQIGSGNNIAHPVYRVNSDAAQDAAYSGQKPQS